MTPEEFIERCGRSDLTRELPNTYLGLLREMTPDEMLAYVPHRETSGEGSTASVYWTTPETVCTLSR